LYIDEKKEVKDVVQIMEAKYRFFAVFVIVQLISSLHGVAA